MQTPQTPTPEPSELNQYQLADQNGRQCEQWLYNNIKSLDQLNGLIDAAIEGQHVEIKSCMAYITDQSHSNGQRCGRFCLEEAQHNFLVQNGGLYIFVVHTKAPQDQALKVQEAFLLPAAALKDITINNNRVISWRTVLKHKAVYMGAGQ